MIFKNENSKKVCNSGNSPQKLQIKSTMLQIVLLVFPKNLTQKLRPEPTAFGFHTSQAGPKAVSGRRQGPALSRGPSRAEPF